MGRRSTSKVRYDGLSQRQQRKLDYKKKYSNPRKDGQDWTDKLFNKLKATENNDGQ